MRNRSATNTIIWIVGVVFLIGLVVWALVRILNYSPTPELESETSFSATGTASQTSAAFLAKVDEETLSETYTNETYGFSISYPAGLRTGPFSSFHALRNNWRVNVAPDIHGTPIVAIVVIRIENDTTTKTYPVFFGAEVRIGTSNNIQRCYESDKGYTMETVADININGVTWKKFIFGNAAATQYLSGASYRTIQNGKCYALEQIRTGSTYKDDSMTTAYSDEELDALYAKTSPIILSFRFTE